VQGLIEFIKTLGPTRLAAVRSLERVQLARVHLVLLERCPNYFWGAIEPPVRSTAP
jgi:hypothetical protein